MLRPTRLRTAINWSRLVTLQWSGLRDVISLQTLCWEIGDVSIGHDVNTVLLYPVFQCAPVSPNMNLEDQKFKREKLIDPMWSKWCIRRASKSTFGFLWHFLSFPFFLREGHYQNLYLLRCWYIYDIVPDALCRAVRLRLSEWSVAVLISEQLKVDGYNAAL